MFGNAALEYAGDVSSLGLRTAHIEKPCNTAHTLSCFGAVWDDQHCQWDWKKIIS